ncbi:MAG: TIGR03663 family protein [Anaerolineae bacterium]|nr:TIGR03663 family protein [Anaerolineae bacterium]
MQNTEPQGTTWLDRPVITNFTINWESLIFAAIIIVAIITRFYDLESRVMSHDENSHVYYAWRLSEGEGYQHNPMTHGPAQFHIVALSYYIFGDNDFTARVPAAIFGVAIVFFLWYYRRYLGRTGTLIAAALMVFSPFMLFYSRYVRNDIFAAFFGIVMIWAILRYLETGRIRYTYWLTAAVMLHYTTKETSFIYSAQALLFLGLLFVHQVTQQNWKNPHYRKAFLVALLVAFGLVAAAIGIYGTIPIPETTAEVVESTSLPLQVLLPIALSALSVVAALYFVIGGYTWARLREQRAFSLIILQMTLILPQLAPLPMTLIGWNPTDYSTQGMLQTGVFVVIFALIAAAIGMAWNQRVWLINAAIFYIPFTIFYTTVFTNGAGFFTGLVGSLGYWLEQQGVERGSQPWYYYLFIQIPVYEYLPLLGSIFAGYLGLRFKDRARFTQGDIDESVDNLDHPIESPLIQNAPVAPLLGFWAVTSIIAYTIAGEKMPWLTVHIAFPMILLTGWSLGKLVESIDWQAVRKRNGLLIIILLIVFIVGLVSVFSSLTGLEKPFQGQTLEQLNHTNAFITALLVCIASAFGLMSMLAKNWQFAQLVRLTALTFFVFLSLLTARAALRAAYINYDYPLEYLVYAHSGSGPKVALAQIEELSRRTTDGLNIMVAYDDENTYPYWWYLRNYTNHKFYGDSPTRELREAPVILVGDNNYDKLEPVVGNAYYQFDYIRIWWPNQDYYALQWSNIEAEHLRENSTDFTEMTTWDYLGRVWGHIRPFFTNPEVRSAILQIWLNRDYSEYAALRGTDMSLQNWQPSDRMRLYVRKDIAAQVWNYGGSGELFTDEEIYADPFEGKEISRAADMSIGEQGSLPGQFNMPRDLAIASDGSMYIADTGNHRVQHLDPKGDVLEIWGSFADSAIGPAPEGTFYEPWGIAVGPEGNVYVTDTWNHRVQKFSSTGEFITEWGIFGQAETGAAFWGPRDIVVGANGQVFIADTGNKRIAVFDLDGNFISEFGEVGLLEGQLDEPVGLAIDVEGQVYVADTWNHRVQVFADDNSSAQYGVVNSWELEAWYGQSLDNKPYLTVDSLGRIFIGDPEGHHILEFNAEGELMQYWGLYGTDPQDLFGLNLPTGMTIDPEGDLWVADAGNHRILRFTIPAE